MGVLLNPFTMRVMKPRLKPYCNYVPSSNRQYQKINEKYILDFLNGSHLQAVEYKVCKTSLTCLKKYGENKENKPFNFFVKIK